MREDQRRYSPPVIVETDKRRIFGSPDEAHVCSSHVERLNLSVRTQLRRFTRLAMGFSRKWDCLHAMLGLFFAHYNFCRKHRTLRTTPAVAAGLATEPWSLEFLVRQAAGC